MGTYSFWANEGSIRFPIFYGSWLGRYLGWVCYPILRWLNNICSNLLRPSQPSLVSLSTAKKIWNQLFQNEVSYLGRLISSEGYTTDPKNIIAVKSKILSPPKTITELRSTLGLVGWFRKSTPNFSKFSNSLYSLLKLHSKVRKISNISNHLISYLASWWHDLC